MSALTVTTPYEKDRVQANKKKKEGRKKAMKRTSETAKQHYDKQLETLHNLIWKMECFNVNEMNRSKEEEINWADCGSMGHIIEKTQEIVRFAKSTEK